MYVLRDVRLLHNPTCNVINKRYYNAAVFPSQAFGCSWSLGLAWLTCPSTPPAANTGDCIVYQLACQTGRPGQLFTHLISLRDKASFDTDSRQLVRMDTHTNTGRLPNAHVCLQQCACPHGNKPRKHTAALGATDPWAGFIWGHRLTNAAGRWLPDSWWSKVVFLSVPSFGWLFFLRPHLLLSVCLSLLPPLFCCHQIKE